MADQPPSDKPLDRSADAETPPAGEKKKQRNRVKNRPYQARGGGSITPRGGGSAQDKNMEGATGGGRGRGGGGHRTSYSAKKGQRGGNREQQPTMQPQRDTTSATDSSSHSHFVHPDFQEQFSQQEEFQKQYLPHMQQYLTPQNTTDIPQQFLPQGNTAENVGGTQGESGSTQGERGNTQGESGNTQGESGSAQGQRGSAQGHHRNAQGQRGNARGQRMGTRGQRGQKPPQPRNSYTQLRMKNQEGGQGLVHGGGGGGYNSPQTHRGGGGGYNPYQTQGGVHTNSQPQPRGGYHHSPRNSPHNSPRNSPQLERKTVNRPHSGRNPPANSHENSESTQQNSQQAQGTVKTDSAKKLPKGKEKEREFRKDPPQQQQQPRQQQQQQQQQQEYQQNGGTRGGVRNQRGQGQGQGRGGGGQRGGGGGGGGAGANRGTGGNKKFEAYWDGEKLQQGLKRGELIQGPIRINPRNYHEAYVPHPDGKSDIFLSSVSERNRALNGDIVAVFINPRSGWNVLATDKETAALRKKLDNMSLKTTDTEDKENIETEEGKTDSSPDVVVEEEIIESSDEEDKMKKKEEEASTASKSVIKDKGATEGASAESASAEGANAEGGSAVNVDAKMDVSESTPPPQKSPVASTPKDTPNTPKQNQSSSRTNTDQSNKFRKFTTVEEMCRGEDSVRKSLFTDAIQDSQLQRTGKVVAIIEKKHSRACTGTLKKMADNNPNVAIFSPMDHRVPRIHVMRQDWPEGFAERPDDFKTKLFVGRITRWDENYTNNAHGVLAKSLGEAGEIEPETEGILLSNDIDFEEFKQDAIECLPDVSDANPWKIPDSEFTYRKDLRKECIFTIDPATARDLDDALHVTDLGDGVYEVGVHIADVSFFVPPDNALDKVAASRATSVYLVQKVIPMLPRLLCEQLCSLNPDEDRLTFSVIWKMRETGEILDEWFGRSVIRSCVKLSYEHAQGFIEHPDREWNREELPRISEGFNVNQIRERVLNLHKIAQNLRRHRFDSGALRLDQVKLSYTLDKESGMPSGFYVFQAKDSNKLVEEFMLLANMAVAHRIYKAYPEIACLRRHPEPQAKMMDELVANCNGLGISLDISSSGAIHRSMQQLAGPDLDDAARMQIMTVLCSKPMQNAKYFCTGCLADEHLYRHYALNVPLYTHFTSPIRRYPDIMVHRLLGASLEYNPPPSLAKEHIEAECTVCNDKKLAAKTASDASADLFFSVFVKECGPMEESGMVIGVLNRAFDVLVLRLGVVKRVYCEKLPLESFTFETYGKLGELTLLWTGQGDKDEPKEQKVTIFTRVHVVLTVEPDDPLKVVAKIKHPDEMVEEEKMAPMARPDLQKDGMSDGEQDD